MNISIKFGIFSVNYFSGNEIFTLWSLSDGKSEEIRRNSHSVFDEGKKEFIKNFERKKKKIYSMSNVFKRIGVFFHEICI